MKGKVIQNIRSFMESRYYVWFLCFITLISYFTGWYNLAFFTFPLFLGIHLLLKGEMNTIGGYFILYTCSWKGLDNYSFESFGFIMLIFLSLFALSCFIYRVIRDHKEIWNRIKRDYIFYFMSFLFLYTALSITWSPNLHDAALGFGQYAVIYFFYLGTRFFIRDLRNSRILLLESIVLMGLVVGIEGFVKLLELTKSGICLMEIITHKEIHLGYAISNHYMGIINTAAIVGLYLFMHYKEWYKKLFIILGEALFILFNILCVCRGGYLGLFLAGPLMIFYYIYHVIKNKKYPWKKDFIYFGILLAFCIGYSLFFGSKGYFQLLIDYLKNIGVKPNGREKVFACGFKAFKEHWLFGAGVGSAHYYLMKEYNWNLWNYHNYYIQMLGTLGILGTLAFTGYLVESIRRNLEWNPYNMIILIVIAYFLGHGFVDTIYFNPVTMPLLSILIASVFPKFVPDYSNIQNQLKLYII